MQERLNRLYEQYGYRKFKMSRFEDYDLYAQNRDFLRQDRIITFTDADGALKALKPDITLSIMKSNGGDSEKVYYNENVCREVGGAFREILQVGVESRTPEKVLPGIFTETGPRFAAAWQAGLCTTSVRAGTAAWIFCLPMKKWQKNTMSL